MKTMRQRVWDVMNNCPGENYAWHLKHFLSLDPACCERQATVADAEAWLRGPEGSQWAHDRFEARAERARERSALEMSRSIRETRNPYNR